MNVAGAVAVCCKKLPMLNLLIREVNWIKAPIFLKRNTCDGNVR